MSGLKKYRSNAFSSLVNNEYFSHPHPLSIKEGLLFQLAMITYLEKSAESKIENEKKLKIIYDAVSKGISETSMYNFKPYSHFNVEELEGFKVFSSQAPVSACKLIENWFKQKQLVDEDKKNNLIVTILKGKFNRKKKLSRTLTACTSDELEIKIPQEIINLILLHLSECNVDEEKKDSCKLTTHARQECEATDKWSFINKAMDEMGPFADMDESIVAIPFIPNTVPIIWNPPPSGLYYWEP